MTLGDNENYNVGLETSAASEDASKSFSGASHLTQLVTLLPNIDDNEGKSNLKVSKGVSAYVKITRNYLNESNSKPQLKNIVRTVPR
jgi:hypothetical protein